MILRSTRRAAAASVALLAAVGGVAAAPASASVRELQLDYVCNFPLMKPQPLELAMRVEIPDTAVIRKQTPRFDITATAHVSEEAARALRGVEAVTIEGGAVARASLEAPGSTSPLNLNVPVTVPQVTLPPTGGFSTDAVGKTPALTFTRVGVAKFGLQPALLLQLTPKLADGLLTGLDAFETECVALPGQDLSIGTINVTDGTGGDVTAPTKPGKPSGSATKTTASFSWSPSTDDTGVTGYDVYKDGVRQFNVTGTSATVTGLTPDTPYQFTVKAVDAASNASVASDALDLRTEPEIVPDTIAPTTPGKPVGVASKTSVSLSWAPSSDVVGVTGYDLYQGDTLLRTVPAPTADVINLTPDTPYTFSVRARDAAGNLSAVSEVLSIRTQPEELATVNYKYSLTGSSTLKTLTKGAVPLTGSIDANLTLQTGAVSADLVLNRTRARLTAIGIIPITADLAFVPSGPTTGSLKAGVLSTTSLLKIRLPQVYLFGAVPIAGPGTCQTKRLSEVKLTSTAPQFNPVVGGTLAGSYAISDLTGCGLLNGLLSPLAAGSGNTISINLTKAGA